MYYREGSEEALGETIELIEQGFLITELLHIMFEDCEMVDTITVETNRRETINKHLRKKIACKVKNRDTDDTIRSLHVSTDVCEPRTATGSRMFPFLARFCFLSMTGKALVGRLWLDVTNVMASKRSKKETNRLPVAVRGSRTSVLKLPNNRRKRRG